MERKAAAAGCIYLSCPVFGRPDVARAAKLLLVMAGDQKAKAIVKSILVPSIGRAVIDAGIEASKGPSSDFSLCVSLAYIVIPASGHAEAAGKFHYPWGCSSIFRNLCSRRINRV